MLGSILQEGTGENGNASAQKLGDRRDHGLLFVFAQFREDGQCQNFAGGAFGFRKVSFCVAQRS